MENELSIVMGKSHKNAVKNMTPQVMLFCTNYLMNNLNATLAASLAGYKNPQVLGSKLLNSPVVQAELSKHLPSPITAGLHVGLLLSSPDSSEGAKLRAAELIFRVNEAHEQIRSGVVGELLGFMESLATILEQHCDEATRAKIYAALERIAPEAFD